MAREEVVVFRFLTEGKDKVIKDFSQVADAKRSALGDRGQTRGERGGGSGGPAAGAFGRRVEAPALGEPGAAPVGDSGGAGVDVERQIARRLDAAFAAFDKALGDVARRAVERVSAGGPAPAVGRRRQAATPAPDDGPFAGFATRAEAQAAAEEGIRAREQARIDQERRALGEQRQRPIAAEGSAGRVSAPMPPANETSLDALRQRYRTDPAMRRQLRSSGIGFPDIDADLQGVQRQRHPLQHTG